MKLFEKSCPNCGAELKFNLNDKEVTCNYCRKSYVIEKDNDAPKELSSEDFQFNEIAGAVKTFSIIHFIITFFIIVFIIGVTIFIFINANSQMKNNNNDSKITNNSSSTDDVDDMNDLLDVIKGDTKSNNNYVTKYSDIDEETKNEFIGSSKSALEDAISFYKDNFMYPVKTSWTYVGSYYLVSNKDVTYNYNYLYNVYKITYVINKKNVDYYGAVRYNDIKLSSDTKIVANMNGKVEAPMHNGNVGEYTFGYESNKDLYNKLIRNNIEDYTVELAGEVVE